MIKLPELPPPSTEAVKIRIRANMAISSTRARKHCPALQFSQVAPRPLDFSRSFLDSHRMPGTARRSTVTCSIVLHAVLLGAALLASIWFADALDTRTFTRTMLVAPPAPPAPAAPSGAAVRAIANSAPRRQIQAKRQLVLPTYIPKQVAMVNEPQIAPEVNVRGIPGGVEGGVPGGPFGGTLDVGLMITPPPLPPAPVPSAPAPKAPVPVGGRVKPPRVLLRVDPVYPLLAQATRVRGVVVISAVIDAQGNPAEMRVVSGHPLLIAAAMNALKQWKFEPTILDGEPVPVSWDITITFQLGG
jgi:protein TonB